MRILAVSGRVLQLVGLVILPLGMILEITGQLGRRGVAELLLILLFGSVAFATGRYLEALGRRSP
jgi:hypothetical protein